MLVEKQTFLMRKDWWRTIKKLRTNAQKARLLEAIFAIQNGDDPGEICEIIDLVLEPMRAAWESDDEKYESVSRRNRVNGCKGGRPRKNPENPAAFWGSDKNPENPENPDTIRYGIDVDNIKNHIKISGKNDFSHMPSSIDDGEYEALKRKMMETFNKFCPSLPKILEISDSRLLNVFARMKEAGVPVEEWEIFLPKLLSEIEESDFLSGRSGVWKANFDWIFSRSKFIKILEGNYKNGKNERNSVGNICANANAGSLNDPGDYSDD